MTPERWQQVASLYEAVLARAPEERVEYLALESADDLELRTQVESLLAHADRPVLVDQSVWEAADGLIDIDPHPVLPEGYQIGPYRVEHPLGVGGMGHVYRARDTKLQRDVALKILPEAFLQDHDRFRSYGRELRDAFRRNPTDCATAIRLLHYSRFAEHNSADVFVTLEKARAARQIAWKQDELITITRFLLAEGYGEAASRFLYTLYLQGELKPGSQLRGRILYQLFVLLSDAGDQRLPPDRYWTQNHHPSPGSPLLRLGRPD